MNKTFGERVREKRISAGLSGSELARRVGIHHTSLMRFERGEFEPQLSVACAIAAALGVGIAELAGCAESHSDTAKKSRERIKG